MIEKLYPGKREGQISERDIEHLLRRHEKLRAFYYHIIHDYCDSFPELIPVAKHLLDADILLLDFLENKTIELEKNS